MRAEEFFIDHPNAGPWQIQQQTLDTELIRQIHSGGVDALSDIDAAVGLARLVHNEFKSRGTDNNIKINVVESRAALSALRSVLRRLGINFSPPFTDFDEFYEYWRREGASGSGGWAARREILTDIFNPIHERLADLQAGITSHELAEPITPRNRTGWTHVDEEISELRRHFKAASTPQDYRNVGNDCVIILERLSEVVYLPERHLVSGEKEPPVTKTKTRLDRVVKIELDGRSNAELRKLTRAAIEHAQAVKHRTPNRLHAGIAADSVILLVNIFRRLVEARTNPSA